jgi:hypothetical protein
MKLFNIFNWVQNLVESFTFYGGGSGGGGSQTSTSYSTNLPEYAKPYYEELMKQSNKNVYSTVTRDMVGQTNPDTGQPYGEGDIGVVTGVKPLPTYTGTRVTGFNPEQLQTQQNVMNMQQQGGFGQATQGLTNAQGGADIASRIGLARALNYSPNQINPQSITAPRLNQYRMGPVERATSQNWNRAQAANYGDPYQQDVTNIALREAQLQGAKDRRATMLGAIGRGTFGGSRNALMQAEQRRNLNQNLSDIQAKGSQAGYENAQKAFLADQANRMAAQQLNVQTGLTSAQQNLAAQLQTQGLSADQAMKAALANQQTNLTAQQSNQQANQQAAQLMSQTGIAGLNSSIDAAKAQAATAAATQTAELERLKAQAATGAEKQSLQQRIDDLQYQTFREQQNYEKQQLEYLSNILRGNAGALGSTQVAYTPAPSTISQIGGLGLAGLGLAKALG